MRVDEPGGAERAGAEIARWLIGEARVTCTPLELIDGFCRRLVERAVPLWRLRAGQRLANPLASAWGVIWTRDGSGTHEYVVPRATELSSLRHFSSSSGFSSRRPRPAAIGRRERSMPQSLPCGGR
jgi:hypothetical protein